MRYIHEERLFGHRLCLVVLFFSCLIPYISGEHSQSICDASNGDTLPTWCKYNNPFVSVNSISDSYYSRDNCYGSNCVVTQDDGVPFTCDGESPYSDCTGVTQIVTIQVKIKSYLACQNSSTTAVCTWFEVPDEIPPSLFIMMGLESGQVVGNYVPNFAPAGYRQQQNGLVHQTHNSSIVMMRSLENPRHAPLESNMVFATSSVNETKLWILNSTTWPPDTGNAEVAWCNVFPHHSMDLIEMHFFQPSHNIEHVVLTQLLRSRTTPNNYVLKFHIVDASKPNLCQDVTRREWQLNLDDEEEEDQEELMGFRVLEHHAGINGTVYNARVNRTVIVLQGSKHVHIYLYDTTNRPASNSDTQVVNVHDTNATSLFFTAEAGSVVGSLDIFGEILQRFTNQTTKTQPVTSDGRSTNPMASELLWLSVSTQSSSSISTDATVETLSLNEFYWSSFSDDDKYGVPLTMDEIVNPGWRVDSAWKNCLGLEWYRGSEGCVPRRRYFHSLDNPVRDLIIRSRGVPVTTAIANGDISSLLDQAIVDEAETECAGVLTQCQSEQDDDPSGQDRNNIICQKYVDCLRNYTNNAASGGGSSDDASCVYEWVLENDQTRQLFQAFLYSVGFMHVQGHNGLHDEVSITGIQPKLCGGDDELVIELMNSISTVGSIKQVVPSYNSMHLFLAVTRNYFDIQGTRRIYDICKRLAQDPSDPFLSAFKETCQTVTTKRGPNINDFAWYSSSCMPGTYCPSFEDVRIFPTDTVSIPSGVYAPRAMELIFCQEGYFCTQGTRTQCPIGYQCPVPNMSLPIRCEPSLNFNTTCFHQNDNTQPGLTAPKPCAEGSMCLVPYMPGIPASPGYAIPSNNRTALRKCEEGDWCVLGRSTTDDLSCPSSCYCNQSRVLEPTVCQFSVDFANYCPEGTAHQLPCPEGNYCSLPNKTSECLPHRYCPAGSFQEETCPEGYYCPTPSQKIICPHEFYCRAGSIKPRPCSFMTYCPEGSSSQKNSAVIPLITFLLFLIPPIGMYLYKKTRDKRREEREERRRQVRRTISEHRVGGQGSMSVSLLSPSMAEFQDDDDSEYDAQKDFYIDFRFEDMGLELKSIPGKKVLNGVTGEIKHGRVTAVMGPSGAGKSTFITTLCGKATYGHRTGRIFINGVEEDLTRFRKITGFVPQDDIMLRMLTVKEILTVNAQLRLPVDMPNIVKRRKVNEVIAALGLTHIRHSIIGDETQRGISGGQRKRVNIGMELVADPIVLFLDEPTSGLDSTSSKEVCQCLRSIAEKGLTIVTVIHQPRYEIFELFHDVLLLGVGGKTIYLGPSTRALEYFTSLGFQLPANANPADFFMDVISGEFARIGHSDFKKEDLFTLWEENRHLYVSEEDSDSKDSSSKGYLAPSPPQEIDFIDPDLSGSVPLQSGGTINGEESSLQYKERSTAGLLLQLAWFARRAVLQQFRQWKLLAFDCALVLFAGLFFGLIYYQRFYIGPSPDAVVQQCPQTLLDENPSPCRLPKDDPLPGQAATTVLTLALASVAGALRVFGNERNNFWRESSAGISTFSYFLGKNLSHMINILLAPLCWLLLFYQLVTPFASFSSMYGICLIVYWTAAGFGYFVSAVSPPSQAQLFGVLSILVSMMFSGMNPRKTQLRKILGGVLLYPTYFSFINYAQEAYYINEIQHYQGIYDDVQTGMDIYEWDIDHYSGDIWGVFLIGLAMRVFAYLALEFLNRDKRK